MRLLEATLTARLAAKRAWQDLKLSSVNQSTTSLESADGSSLGRLNRARWMRSTRAEFSGDVRKFAHL